MKRIWAGAFLAGIVALVCSCRQGAGKAAAVDGSVERSDEELRRLLGFPLARFGWMERIDSVGRNLAKSLPSDAGEPLKIEAISGWLGSTDGVRPVEFPDDTDLVPSLAWERHRGGCTSLSWIWMRLAKAMDLDLQPVLLPGHMTLRTKEGRFVETLRGGLERSTAFYDSAFSLAKRPAYRLDAANVPVLEASLLVHRGLLLWNRQDLTNSEACFRKASELVPGMPEAEGNLGLVLEARGERVQARAHLATALAGDSLNGKARVRWEALSKDGTGP